MRRAALAAVVGSMVIAGAAGAQAQPTHTPGDPWEGFNRGAYALENVLDRVFFGPAAAIFRHLSPGPIGQGIHNLILNLTEPNTFANDMLQGRLKRAGRTAGRFLLNSSFGVGGLFDVGQRMGLPHQDNEFGVTLGVWGVKSGPYLYLPLVGPSTVRDLFGTGVDTFIDPFHWVAYANRFTIGAARTVVSGLDQRVSSEAQLNALLADAADPYATLRSVYLQNKEAQVRGEASPLENLPSFDEPAPSAPPAPATAGAVVIEDKPAPVPAVPVSVASTASAPLPAAPDLTPALAGPAPDPVPPS
jgi:phospholipid-binding lipoprotein MlaA